MSLTIAYPSTGTPTHTVTLRNPSFGETIRITEPAIIRRTRGGTLRAAPITDWLRKQDQTWQFEMVRNIHSDYVIAELKALLVVSAGKKVAITDHLGNSYTAVITNASDISIVTNRDYCAYSFELSAYIVSMTDTFFYVGDEALDPIITEDGEQLVMEGYS